jgi:protein OS-9
MLAGRTSFVCLIPPPVESHTQPIEEPQMEAPAIQTFGLLHSLTNQCIYVSN